MTWHRLSQAIALLEATERAEAPPVIVSDTHLWALWDPHSSFSGATVSEGYMATMLGLDRVALRGAYLAFLKRENAEAASDVRIRQVKARLEARKR